jgi:hypothetical protein
LARTGKGRRARRARRRAGSMCAGCMRSEIYLPAFFFWHDPQHGRHVCCHRGTSYQCSLWSTLRKLAFAQASIVFFAHADPIISQFVPPIKAEES